MVVSYSSMINNKTLNTSLNAFCRKIGNGIDSSAFNTLVNDSTARLAPKIGQSKTTAIFNQIDCNNDKTVTLDELKTYLKKFYGVNIEQMLQEGKTVEDLVDKIEEHDKNLEKAIKQAEKEKKKKNSKPSLWSRVGNMLASTPMRLR